MFHHKLVSQKQALRVTAWGPALSPKKTYIPGVDIHSNEVLAMHSIPLHVSSVFSPDMADVAYVPAPVTCQLCHQSLVSMEALQRHCAAKHDNYAEYRKRLFFKPKGRATNLSTHRLRGP